MLSALLRTSSSAVALALAFPFLPGALGAGTSNIKSPVYFEPDGSAYLVRGLKTGARLERGGALRLSLPRSQSFELRFLGANRDARAEALDPLPGRTHYFLGRDPRKWRTGVPQYGRLRYRDVYPGIDVVYYTKPGSLEYDFVVAPGAGLHRIRLGFSGASAAIVDSGDLLIEAGGRKLRHARPRIYQEAENGRVEIAGRYRIDRRGEVRIDVDGYDSRKPLVIDPVIVYSTLLGGDDVDDIQGLAVDAQGSVYVTGAAGSANFPGSPPPGARTRTQYATDAYVLKMNPAGTAVVFTAFFGSVSSTDTAAAIALDPSGNIYVTGSTSSSDFPVTPNAAQSRLNSTDAFLVKLDPTGSRLLYATLLGGGNHDFAQAVAATPAGHAVAAGYTYSTDFPEVAPVASPSGAFEAFIFRVDTVSGRLIHSSAFGGSRDDKAYGVALDGAGNAYVTGTTLSSDFPVTARAFQTVSRGYANAFVAKLNPAGDAFLYSTLLGGSASGATTNVGNAIAVDAAGNAYVAGTTNYPDFPTTVPLTPPPSTATGAFITKVNADGSGLVYSSPIGRDWTYGNAVAVAPNGEAWITGSTASEDFPRVSPVQRAWGGKLSDWFVCRVNSAGAALSFSSFIGGLGDEGGLSGSRRGGVALDPAGNVYVAGHTTSGDFPTTAGVLQTRYGGYATAAANAGDGFIVKIDPARDPAPVVVTPSDHVITTIAGGGATIGAAPGPATQAAIGPISAMALHPSGAVLFASYGCEAGFLTPGGSVIPGFCSGGPIRSVSPDGFLRMVAGAPGGSLGEGDGGPAVKAALDVARGLAADAAGNIFIAESDSNFGNRVWKVDTGGIIHRIAGTGSFGHDGDGGPGRSARLGAPTGLVADALGNLYIAESDRIRKLAPDGTISTIAGGGTANVTASPLPATQVQLNSPRALAMDRAGILYIAGEGYIHRMTPGGDIAAYAGKPLCGVPAFNGDARPASTACLSNISALAVGPGGELYIADTGNNRVRRIDRDGMIWNVAGTLGPGSSGDNGPGELAQLNGPVGIAFDSAGNLYIAEAGRIRKLGIPRPLPEFYSGGVITAAGYRPGAVIARGSIFSIYGAGLGPAEGLATPGYPLGAWLADVTVRVKQGESTLNAIPLYVSAGQINAIMPSDAPLGEVQIQVLYAGFPSRPVTVRVARANFQFFVAGDPEAGLFQTVASPADYPLCTRAAPARPGQIVIGWGSGLGAGLDPDNSPPQGAGLPVDVEVLVGGKPAQVLYKGRAPGFAGVDNLYFVIPGDAPRGCRIPVQVRAGGVDSEPVTIAISAGGACEE